jgi:hypothetical protein
MSIFRRKYSQLHAKHITECLCRTRRQRILDRYVQFYVKVF